MPTNTLLRKLWTKSPRDYWQRFVASDQRAFRPWLEGKQRNWSRLVFYLEVIKAFASRAGHPLHFSNAQVLEVGAGQVLGLLPMALIEGAAGAVAAEPDYREIRGNQSFCDDYLYPLYTLYRPLIDQQTAGSTLSYENFLDCVKQIRIETAAIEQMRSGDSLFDIVLSKSCLEHIADIPTAVRCLHALSRPGSVHVHYIDFALHYGEHHVTGNRFGKTYHRARAACPEYLANPGGIINLLRASDMVTAFRAHFAEVHFFPTLNYAGRLDHSNRHADWQHYDDADLSVANGILVAVK